MSETNLAGTMTWHGPTPLDMGTYGASYVGYFNGPSAAGPVLYRSTPQAAAKFSYQDFDLLGSPGNTSATLVANVYASVASGPFTIYKARPIVRSYVPGSGWASPGPKFLLADDGSIDYTDTLLAPGANGDLLVGFFVNDLSSVFSFEALATGTLFHPPSSNQLFTGFNNASGAGIATDAVAALQGNVPPRVFGTPSVPSTPPIPFSPVSEGWWRPSSMTWDSLGRAWSAANLPQAAACSGFACQQLEVTEYSPATGWLPGAHPLTFSTSYAANPLSRNAAAPKVQLLNDGLGVTAVYLDFMDFFAQSLPGAPAGLTRAMLKSGWSLAPSPSQPFGTVSDLSTISGGVTSQVYGFAAAADQSGDVVTVFLQDLQPQPSIPLPPSIPDTIPPNRFPFVRLFASVRSASGAWVGPTRIDTNFSQAFTTSSFFQDSDGNVFNQDVVGGVQWPSPGIAYIGNGRFLAAWAELDNVAHTSGLYVRGYTVGTGWDPDSQIVTLEAPSYLSNVNHVSTPIEAYRFVNDLQMVGDGNGDAMLILNYVIQSNQGLTVNDRNTAIKVYRYVAGQGWDTGFVIPESYCQASTSVFSPSLATPASHYCWNLRAKGYIFPGGESAVVFPALSGGLTGAVGVGTVANPAAIRLFSMEYRQ